jgi:hypothetical protein
MPTPTRRVPGRAVSASPSHERLLPFLLQLDPPLPWEVSPCELRLFTTFTPICLRLKRS